MKKLIYTILCFLLIVLPGCRSTPPTPKGGQLELTFLLDEEIENVDRFDVKGFSRFRHAFAKQGIKGLTATVTVNPSVDWIIIVTAKNAEGVIVGEGHGQASFHFFSNTVSVEIPISPPTFVGFIDENLEAVIRDPLTNRVPMIFTRAIFGGCLRSAI